MTTPLGPIQPNYFWAPAVTSIGLNTVLYIVAQIIKDNSIVDITWGFMFVIPNAVVLGINKNGSPRSILSNVLILVYAFRLAIYNFVRHKEEDWRFKEMREGWLKKGKACYYFAAYMQIFVI